MDFLTGKIKPIYFKYLVAAFGSAMISCIYGVMGMAMVGQYQGPEGTAALAVVAPVWNVIYSLGLLTGIGGSVIFSTRRGSSTHSDSENQYFIVSVARGLVISGVLIMVLPTLVGAVSPVVCHAGHRAADCPLYRGGHPPLHRRPARLTQPPLTF